MGLVQEVAARGSDFRYTYTGMSDGPDADSLTRLGGTDSGGWFEASSGVLVAIPNERYVQTGEGARASLEELRRISHSENRRYAVIVLVDRVASQNSAGRRVWSRELEEEDMCGLVLVCRSRLSRAIGSFFLGIHRPKVPTSMVATWDEAFAWACRRAAESERTRTS